MNYERGAMTLAELSSGSASAIGPSANFAFLSQPIQNAGGLVKIARRISHGELDAPSLGVEDRTEFGELSRALERIVAFARSVRTS